MFFKKKNNAKQIKLNELFPIVSKADLKGNIKYVNHYFKEHGIVNSFFHKNKIYIK